LFFEQALSEMAFEFAQKVLKEGGNLVLKANQGGTEAQLKKRVAACFEKVEWYKPDASFRDSSEIYLIAKNYKGNPNK
jgi:23S rRNA (uridine2552-2'-O)-methyltransferase